VRVTALIPYPFSQSWEKGFNVLIVLASVVCEQGQPDRWLRSTLLKLGEELQSSGGGEGGDRTEGECNVERTTC